MTFRIIALSLTAFSIKTLTIIGFIATLSMDDTKLGDTLQSVVMPSVIVLSVVAPITLLYNFFHAFL
jgi:hypothetical protein